ncbi:16380_t:CDS:10 [Funneliformis mosseae]|uniref:16380_t:CDS:1 n=1 Tax=Funneliformis mosseae TaxID=27381 RepID=A0A9N9GL10_FUNMO|nr:16380_t:CDS:10 [Funneliformis mosseae]
METDEKRTSTFLGIDLDRSKKLKKFNSIKIIREQGNDGIINEHTTKTNEHAYDILYENQRGLFLFGLPKFSSKALNQVDPNSWTDRNQKYSPMDIYNFQLPDPTWEWVHKEWLIDMSGDVDEEGWEYAFNFHSSSWHGCYQPLRSFVRRRRWIRLRRKKGKDGSASIIPKRTYLESDEKLDDFEELWRQVKMSRLDREKLKYISDYINNGGNINKFHDRLSDFIGIFDHQESSKKFLEVLPANGPFMLKYFSDIRELLDHVKHNINNVEVQKKSQFKPEVIT